MAVSSGMQWEIRQSATAGGVNGAGFNPIYIGTSTDYSQQDAAAVFNGDLSAILSSTQVTSLLSTFPSNVTGNVMHITTTGTGAFFTVGWYEIVGYIDANNVQLDRAPAAGAGGGVAGSYYVGGAFSLNSTLDDDLFEQLTGNPTVWMKYSSNAYTLGESASIINTSFTAIANAKFIGYNTTRGDNPTGANRPTLNAAANGWIAVANWTIKNIIDTHTASNGFGSSGVDAILENVKGTNTSNTLSRVALGVSTGGTFVNCEACSLNGAAFSLGTSARMTGCYAHDSNNVVNLTTNTSMAFVNNIFENIKVAAFTSTIGTPRTSFYNNTFYGSEAKIGTGIAVLTSTSGSLHMLNNIFYGLGTGILIGTQKCDATYENYNCFFNNSTDMVNVGTGPNSVYVNPAFTNASQLTGSSATTSASQLFQAGANFGSVTANQDVLHLISGTGTSNGTFYLITAIAGTSLTLSTAPGTSAVADKVWSIGIGHNFMPTGNI